MWVLFYRNIYLQIPFSKKMVNLKIPFYLETLHVALIHCRKQITMKSRALDPKAKNWLERNWDRRNAKTRGGKYCCADLYTPFPGTLTKSWRIRAQSSCRGTLSKVPVPSRTERLSLSWEGSSGAILCSTEDQLINRRQ